MTNAADELTQLKASCRRSLFLHGYCSPKQWFERLAQSPYAGLLADEYGDGGVVRVLEERMAELLQKPASLLFSRGIIAQMAAMRVWADRTGRHVVAAHPRSHVALGTQNGLERLHPISLRSVGEDFRPFTALELGSIAEGLCSTIVELPLRRAGFQLPSWNDLAAIADWCKSREVPLHFDGARIWESAPYYERPVAQLAALADSIYVSLYKSVGGWGGGILAGSPEFIEQARLWRARHAGVLPYNAVLAVAALEGMERHLPKMPEYCARAREIALALRQELGLRTTPDVPQTNGFHAYLPIELAVVDRARREIAEHRSVWLFNKLIPAQMPGHTVVEFWIGDAARQLSTAEIVELIASMIRARPQHGGSIESRLTQTR